MTTPNGDPAWVRTSTAETMGGHINKRNYQLVGVVNPETDVDASEFLRLAVDVASNSRVAAFSKLVAQCADSGTPTNPTITSIEQMTAVSTAGYLGDSPSHVSFPLAYRIGDGAFTATWPVTVDDEYGVSGEVVIRYPRAYVINSVSFSY